MTCILDMYIYIWYIYIWYIYIYFFFLFLFLFAFLYISRHSKKHLSFKGLALWPMRWVFCLSDVFFFARNTRDVNFRGVPVTRKRLGNCNKPLIWNLSDVFIMFFFLFFFFFFEGLVLESFELSSHHFDHIISHPFTKSSMSVSFCRFVFLELVWYCWWLKSCTSW